MIVCNKHVVGNVTLNFSLMKPQKTLSLSNLNCFWGQNKKLDKSLFSPSGNCCWTDALR